MRRYSFTKLISIALVLCMALAALAGCNAGKPSETPTVTTPVVTPEATPDATPGATPEATPEATPDATPDATPEETPAETPAESEPLVSYNISYNLDGGYDGGNPATYNGSVEIALLVPVKPGYDFVGWTGTGLTAPTVFHKIGKGTTGDLTFTANWKENAPAEDSKEEIDTTHFGKDDGIKPAENTPIASPDRYGARGEGIFILKTVYTEIAIDGTMDAAYTYGLRFKSDIPTNEEYYEGRTTSFDAYVIRGQDGRLYCYVNIIDPDIVVNDYIFKTDGEWRVDSLDIYYEFGNYGTAHYLYSFVPDPTGVLKRLTPKDTKIVMTDTGYAVEFAFDNNGEPTGMNDEISIQFYLNDANEWNPDTKKYRKEVLKHHSALNPVEKGFILPNNNYGLHDAVKITLASASGKVDTGIGIPEKTGDMIADILSGAASVALVYDAYATAQSELPARELSSLFSRGMTNVSLIPEDVLKSGDTKFDYVFYFGKTTYEGSVALLDKLNYVQYGVSVSENSICMSGWQQGASDNALAILLEIIEHVKNGGKTADFAGATYTGTLEGCVGGDIPELDGYSAITDVGEGAWQLYKVDSTRAEYDAYIAKLEALGYKKYTENNMGGVVYCATYTKGDTVVNAQWGGENDKSIRIVVEPLANTALPSLERPADADANVTVSSVTLMYPHNLCIVFQLSNGHFVIVDSGNNNTQKVLSDFLREKAPDGKPVVEAWFITHFHQDHVGGLVDLIGVSSLMRYITIKSVIYNFPSDQVIQTAHKSVTDMKNMSFWYDNRLDKLREKGTTIYQARTGQKYYFGNAEIEILWTFEDIMPFNVYADRTNPTCIGFSVTIGGQKIMVTGDTSTEEFSMAANKYGSYLKSDMVQLAHHGAGDGNGTHDFYTLVDPSVILWPRPAGEELGNNERRIVNLVKERGGLIVRSGAYGIATLKLPFTVGDEFESKGTY